MGVTYGKDHTAKRIDIRRASASLANEPFSVEDRLDETTASEVLDEVLTPSVHKGLLPGINSITGTLGQSSYTLGRIVVTRYFWGSESRLAGYSIVWQ